MDEGATEGNYIGLAATPSADQEAPSACQQCGEQLSEGAIALAETEGHTM